jgi:hypothetical protein
MTPDELDRLILELAHPQFWRKVARIVGTIGMNLPNEAGEKYDAIAARIVALVEAGKLEAQGDLSEWRHSEVRLTQRRVSSAAHVGPSP